MSIFLIIQVIAKGIVQPYVIKHFGLNYKDSMFTVILCYFSVLYGMISIVLIMFFEKRFKNIR